MGAWGFFLMVGVLFSIALYAAGYYVWSAGDDTLKIEGGAASIAGSSLSWVIW